MKHQYKLIIFVSVILCQMNNSVFAGRNDQTFPEDAVVNFSSAQIGLGNYSIKAANGMFMFIDANGAEQTIVLSGSNGSIGDANTLDGYDSLDFLRVSQNLADIGNASIARTNLGLNSVNLNGSESQIIDSDSDTSVAVNDDDTTALTNNGTLNLHITKNGDFLFGVSSSELASYSDNHAYKYIFYDDYLRESGGAANGSVSNNIAFATDNTRNGQVSLNFYTEGIPTNDKYYDKTGQSFWHIVARNHLFRGVGNPGDTDEQNDLLFAYYNGSTSSWKQTMRLDPTGSVIIGVGEEIPAGILHVHGLTKYAFNGDISTDAAINGSPAATTIEGFANCAFDTDPNTADIYGNVPTEALGTKCYDKDMSDENYQVKLYEVVVSNEDFVVKEDGSIGIGTRTPSARVNIYNNSLLLETEGNGSASDLLLQSYTNLVDQTNLISASRFRGSKASPAIVQANDELLKINAKAFDGTRASSTANITFTAGDNIATDKVASKILFSTTNDNGDLSANTIIDSNGAINLVETIATRAAVAGYGKIYVNSADKGLYYMNDNGDQIRVATAGPSGTVGDSLMRAGTGTKAVLWANGDEASGDYSTAFGFRATANGENSTAFGQETTAIGTNSTAFGYSTLANGNNSLAFGGSTQAIANRSTAFGSSTEATGVNSTTFGNNTRARGANATSFGNVTVANGDYSTAWGYNTVANGGDSTAFGRYTRAEGERATAFGRYSRANGDLATAFGDETVASGYRSTAWGLQAIASNSQATAWGNDAQANGDGSTAWGHDTRANGTLSTAFGDQSVAEGYGATVFGRDTVANGLRSTAWGNSSQALSLRSTAFGYSTVANGDDSTAWGNDSEAHGLRSTAFGYQTSAVGNQALAWGTNSQAGNGGTTAWGENTIANGVRGTVFGIGTRANGTSSTAFGSQSIASGILSTAFGYSTTASGYNSTAFGYETFATNNQATAWGNDAQANGDGSTAWGHDTRANGTLATAWGDESIASGDGSTAFGKNTISNGTRSTAFGEGAIANGEYSTAIGTHIVSQLDYNVTIGSGNSAGDQLINNNGAGDGSLAVGFNSNAATLYVGPGSGGSTLGNVGIGTDSPQAILTINGEGKTMRLDSQAVSNASLLIVNETADDPSLTQQVLAFDSNEIVEYGPSQLHISSENGLRFSTGDLDNGDLLRVMTMYTNGEVTVGVGATPHGMLTIRGQNSSNSSDSSLIDNSLLYASSAGEDGPAIALDSNSLAVFNGGLFITGENGFHLMVGDQNSNDNDGFQDFFGGLPGDTRFSIYANKNGQVAVGHTGGAPSLDSTITLMDDGQGNGAIFAIEESSKVPSARTGYGKLYVKSSDNSLYFMDETGSESLIGGSGAGSNADTLDGLDSTDFVQVANGLDEIVDADDDTKIEVEASADSDSIDITTNGNLALHIGDNGNMLFGVPDSIQNTVPEHSRISYLFYDDKPRTACCGVGMTETNVALATQNTGTGQVALNLYTNGFPLWNGEEASGLIDSTQSFWHMVARNKNYSSQTAEQGPNDLIFSFYNGNTFKQSLRIDGYSGNIQVGTIDGQPESEFYNPQAELTIAGDSTLSIGARSDRIDRANLLIKNHGSTGSWQGQILAVDANEVASFNGALSIQGENGISFNVGDVTDGDYIWATKINNDGMVAMGNYDWAGIPSSNGFLLTLNGALALKEIDTQGSTLNYGKLYVKSSDSSLYFLDELGNEILLGGSSTINGGAFSASGGVIAPSGLVDTTSDDFVFGSSQLDGLAGTGDDQRMFFDKSTAAFRAGSDNGKGLWDEASLGQNSAAFGFGTEASGEKTMAWGHRALARGPGATAWGNNTRAGTAGLGQSTAFGISTIANGHHATAFGARTQALKQASTAFGEDTIADGYRSTAWGNGSITRGINATAWGSENIVNGNDATAFGLDNIAEGSRSFVFGQNGLALGIENLVFGRHSVANGSQATAFGAFSFANGDQATAFGNRAQAHGLRATAFGYDTRVTADDATAWGHLSQAMALRSTAFGYSTLANGHQAVAWGTSTLASGGGSTAFGEGTEATGIRSTAFGGGNIANGVNSTAFGSTTVANGDNSTAFGWLSTADGLRATAFGYNTEAKSSQSTAWGYESVANGNESTAWGYQSRANGLHATAFGSKAVANGTNSIAMGTSAVASEGSIAIGNYVNSLNGWVIGIGHSPSDMLVNDHSDINGSSLMIGFNSNAATLFVGPSAGGSTTGKVSIGTTVTNGTLTISGSASDSVAARSGFIDYSDILIKNEGSGSHAGQNLSIDSNEINAWGSQLFLMGENGFGFNIGDITDGDKETIGTVFDTGLWQFNGQVSISETDSSKLPYLIFVNDTVPASSFDAKLELSADDELTLNGANLNLVGGEITNGDISVTELRLGTSGTQSISSSTNISIPSGSTLIRVEGNSGAATNVGISTTSIDDGRMILLKGMSNTNTVEIVDSGVGATGNVRLNTDTNMTLNQDQTLTLIYDSVAGAWLEMARSQN